MRTIGFLIFKKCDGMISDLHIRYETLSVKFNEPPKTFGRCLKRIHSSYYIVSGDLSNRLQKLFSSRFTLFLDMELPVELVKNEELLLERTLIFEKTRTISFLHSFATILYRIGLRTLCKGYVTQDMKAKIM